jgi:predicted nucleic-acid-binding Zn-ribbon protein
MSEVRYAVCCKNCGHIEDKSWDPGTGESHSKRTERPLVPQGHVPIYCQKCGNRSWQRPATKEQVEAFDTLAARTLRATELTRREDFEGMFKVPDEIRADATIKRALANLLGPLDGDVLKAAQQNVLKVARSGMQGDTLAWIDYYDRAVAKALPKKVAA